MNSDAKYKLVFRLVVPGRLPLLNALLSMSHWQRVKFKKQEQAKFLSACKAAANDSPIQTGLSPSIFSICYDTAVKSLTTQQAISALRLAKRKSVAKKPRKLSSRFTKRKTSK